MSQRSIAVVDGNSLLHRAFHALPETMTAPDGRPTNAVVGFLSMLVKMIADLRPDGVVVAFDLGRPAFRIEALERYKVHRPPTAEALKVQFPMVKDMLRAMSVPVLEAQGWEGDDILGTLAARGEALGFDVLLVTGDRDAFQLVTEHVKVVTTKKGLTDIAVYGPTEVEERYGVTPAQVADYLGLKGDTSDNIPGVPGVGEKTAAKLLQEHGSLDAVLAAADSIPGKVGESLREHRGEALASRTVATISREAPVECDLETLHFGDFDPAEVARAFSELRLNTLRDRVFALRSTLRDTAPGQESPAEKPTREIESREVVTGEDALTRVRAWAGAGAWLGVAIEIGAASLFDEQRDLAVAGPGAVALVPPEAEAETLALLASEAHVATGDAKALLGMLAPPDETQAESPAFSAADPARLFDCGIAGYLLESGRSAYDLGALSADYLGAPLAASTDAMPQAAVLASAAADLAPELERRLVEDESASVLRDIEMPLVPVLVRMERVGVGVDTSVLAGLAVETRQGIDALRAEVYSLAGCEFVIDSPKQLAEVLFEKLQLPVGKRTKTGFSTDASVLATLVPIHPIAEKIIAYRELTKLTSTYIEALPKMLGADGRLHTSFNQTVAATGRLSSSSPNLQNIPVRTEFGRRIRAAFVPADSGDVMVSADYSQIELRVLAHLSGDAGLIEAFTSGADFHQATAARVFGVAPDQVEPRMRARAKAVNFGIVYGQSAHGLAETLKIPHPEAQAMIDRYYAAYPRVRTYLDETVADAHRNGYATTMFGRKRRIPELSSGNHNLRSFGERTAMNHPMQGTAADIMKLAMIEADRRLRAEGFRSRMVLQVHDELVFESPVDEVERLSAMARDAMSGVAALAVPLEVSVSSGPNWASAK
jgi:DNA polymerase-1